MKKNLLLYVLLIFLITVNGFFLYNYLGNTNGKEHVRGPINFIINELNFSDVQMQELNENNRIHHQAIRRIMDAKKMLKDNLFNKISEDQVSDNTIDSIINQISNLEKEQEKLTFYHLKSIQKICNDKQKAKFKRIINDALHKAGRNRRREGMPGGPLPPRH